MSADVSWPAVALALAALFGSAFPVNAQSAHRDGIADLISKSAGEAKAEKVAETTPPTTKPAVVGPPAPAAAPPAAAPVVPKDPREGEQAYEQARQLMLAVDAILQDTAEQRSQAQKLPGRDEFILTPLWTETREDREARIRALLDSALGIVTDVPIVEMQKKVEGLRQNIRDIEANIATLKEKQITAPKDAMLPGVLNDTVASLDGNIKDAEQRITKNQDEIAKTKTEIAGALAKSGVELTPDQVDLLLDSVLSGDLVRLVAVFNAAKVIDTQLGKLLTAAGDNMNSARKYFAMHAALFAMLVHAQELGHREDRHQLHAEARCHPEGHHRRRRPRRRSCCRARTGPTRSARSKPTATRRRWRPTRPRAIAATCSSSASRSPRRARAPCTICASPTTPTRRWRRASS